MARNKIISRAKMRSSIGELFLTLHFQYNSPGISQGNVVLKNKACICEGSEKSKDRLWIDEEEVRS